MRSARPIVLPLVCALALGAPTPVRAQRPAAPATRAALVTSTAWLAQHLRDPGLVLLHVGDRAEYDAKHIPGARFVSMRDVAVQEDGLMLQMPGPDTLRARLAALGISDGSRVVVYYGNDWVSPATRVLLTLHHAGIAHASLLDGGMHAWVRDGHAVTHELPPARVGTLSPLRTQGLVVDAAFVREALGRRGVVVVDGRAASFYDGVQTGGMPAHPHRTGHIAGARSVPFTQITDDRLFLKSPEELRALFAKAGVQPGDTVVGYCHIGQQATAMLFAARTLGHPVLLYDGSYEDWSRRAELPVENPGARK